MIRPVLHSLQRERIGFFLGGGEKRGFTSLGFFVGKCLLRLGKDGKLQVKDQGRVIQSHLKKGEKWKALWKDESICKGAHCHGSLVKEESQRQPVAGPIRALW